MGLEKYAGISWGKAKPSDFILGMVGNADSFKQGKFMCESNFLYSSIFQLEFTFLPGGFNCLRQFKVFPSFPRTVS